MVVTGQEPDLGQTRFFGDRSLPPAIGTTAGARASQKRTTRRKEVTEWVIDPFKTNLLHDHSLPENEEA